MSNANLRNAQISQKDEFYITYQDVQEELRYCLGVKENEKETVNNVYHIIRFSGRMRR